MLRYVALRAYFSCQSTLKHFADLFNHAGKKSILYLKARTVVGDIMNIIIEELLDTTAGDLSVLWKLWRLRRCRRNTFCFGFLNEILSVSRTNKVLKNTRAPESNIYQAYTSLPVKMILQEANWTSKKAFSCWRKCQGIKRGACTDCRGVYSVCIHAFHQMKAWLRFVDIRNNALRVPRFPSAALAPKCFTILLIAGTSEFTVLVAFCYTSLKHGSFP